VIVGPGSIEPYSNTVIVPMNIPPDRPMKRKIAAIMAADIAGYSRLVAEDEEETLRRLAAYREVFDDFVVKSSGRIFNTAGDAVLSEFSSAVEAVRCAIDIQESLRTRNLAYPASRQMNFRIGITIGDVVERNGDLLGDGVNIAARLEGIAPIGGICVSRNVYEQVANKLSVQFADIGEQQVKNIPTPVHAFTVAMGGIDGDVPKAGSQKQHVRKTAAFSDWSRGWRRRGCNCCGRLRSDERARQASSEHGGRAFGADNGCGFANGFAGQSGRRNRADDSDARPRQHSQQLYACAREQGACHQSAAGWISDRPARRSDRQSRRAGVVPDGDRCRAGSAPRLRIVCCRRQCGFGAHASAASFRAMDCEKSGGGAALWRPTMFRWFPMSHATASRSVTFRVQRTRCWLWHRPARWDTTSARSACPKRRAARWSFAVCRPVFHARSSPRTMSFVVAVPTSMKVVGFFKPAAERAIAPGEREDVARRRR